MVGERALLRVGGQHMRILHGEVINMFKGHGFEEVVGGNFNEANPFEIGMGYSNGRRDRDQAIASAVGIRMPATFSPQQVLELPEPVVAKMPAANAGELKYLLETSDQKQKFITWATLADSTLGKWADRHPKSRLHQMIDDATYAVPYSLGIFDNTKYLDDWVFEEFIITPGNYYSSIRVVVDAGGNFHYAEVARSASEKVDQQIVTDDYDYQKFLKFVTPHSIRWLELSESPLYLSSRRFVSNIMAGGQAILLNGVEPDAEVDKNLLADLQIDPKNPRLPGRLLDISSEIGKLCRKYFPWVGIDYILKSPTDEAFLLEINAPPALSPESLNMSVWDGRQCALEMVRRVTSNLLSTSRAQILS